MKATVVALLFACNTKNGDSEPVPTDGPPASVLAPSPRLYRLTHPQWDRTTIDLLKLDASSGLAETFIGDTLHDGFDNNGDALLVSPELFQDYQRAAESLASLVVSDATRYARVVPQDPRTDAVPYDVVVEVESAPGVTYDNGDVSGDGWMLWSDGTMYIPLELPDRTTYQFTVRMNGSDCGDGVYASSRVTVDGAELATFETTAAFADYATEALLGAGAHTLGISFTNDCYDPDAGTDRNLVVDRVTVTSAGGALGVSTAGPAEARAWLADFLPRAWRRPVTDAEIDTLYALFEQGPALVASGDDFADGVRVVVGAALQSPYYLYRIEASTLADESGRVPLDDHEVASKLSYALWGTMPDDALFALAAAGRLSTADDVSTAAADLLADPRAHLAVADFHHQLLALDLVANVVKDEGAFPMFDETWPGTLVEEAERFVEGVVWAEDGGWTDLMSADYTWVNGPLAGVYGVSGPADDATWSRVTLDADRRSGLLTQAWFLATHADATTPSIIHRGVFVNEKILCVEIPDPPPSVEPLPAPSSGETNRERVSSHTGEGTCGEVCHATLINPPGYALENYDALGIWRDEDNGEPVDAASSYTLSDGVHTWVDGITFTRLLASHPDTHDCYAGHWLEYLLSRARTEDDRALLAPIAAASATGDSVRDVMTYLLASDAFRYRADEPIGETP